MRGPISISSACMFCNKVEDALESEREREGDRASLCHLPNSPRSFWYRGRADSCYSHRRSERAADCASWCWWARIALSSSVPHRDAAEEEEEGVGLALAEEEEARSNLRILTGNGGLDCMMRHRCVSVERGLTMQTFGAELDRSS